MIPHSMEMTVIQVCVGSSCHLKGAPELAALLDKKIKELHMEDRVCLTGCFCAGRCNRNGVTILVDDETYTGITLENFSDFWNDKVEPVLRQKGE